MIWGAFSVHDYTSLYRVEGGTLNSDRYIQLLRDVLIPVLPMLLPNGGYFQQDNARAHRSRATKIFLEKNAIKIFNWPSNSPDMSPIENVWGIMQSILNRDYEVPKSANELFATLEQIWISIMKEKEYRTKLIDSMNDRVHALDVAKGSFTKY